MLEPSKLGIRERTVITKFPTAAEALVGEIPPTEVVVIDKLPDGNTITRALHPTEPLKKCREHGAPLCLCQEG